MSVISPSFSFGTLEHALSMRAEQKLRERSPIAESCSEQAFWFMHTRRSIFVKLYKTAQRL